MPDLLLSYYGDDLTGSTDVMEALPPAACRPSSSCASRRLRSWQRFDGVRAIGLAGTAAARARPGWTSN